MNICVNLPNKLIKLYDIFFSVSQNTTHEMTVVYVRQSREPVEPTLNFVLKKVKILKKRLKCLMISSKVSEKSSVRFMDMDLGTTKNNNSWNFN